MNAGASKLRQRVTNALVGGGAAIPLGGEGEAGAGVGADAIPRRPSHDPKPQADEPVQEELEAKEADEQAVEEGGGGTAPPPTRTSGAHVLSEVRRGMEAGGVTWRAGPRRPRASRHTCSRAPRSYLPASCATSQPSASVSLARVARATLHGAACCSRDGG